MAIFKRNLMRWNEPIFFVPRMRTRSEWRGKIILAIVVAVVMSAGLMAARFGIDAGGPRLSVPLAILAGMGVGVLLVAVRELVWFQRDISIDEKNITCFANAGMMTALTTVPLAGIARVIIQRPEECELKFGLMTVKALNGIVLVGIPGSVACEKLAQVLHDQGVTVELKDWEPVTIRRSTAPMTLEEVERTAPRVTGMARIWEFDQPADQRVLSRPVIICCTVISLGPLVAALISSIGIWIYTWMHRAELDTLSVALWIGGGFGCLVVPFVLVAAWGDHLPNLWIRSLMRIRLRHRPDAIIDSEDTESHYIDIVPRKNWGKVMLMSNSDSGFLKITSDALLYEGDAERWQVPLLSLMGCQVEKVSRNPGAPDTDEGAFSYYLVLQANPGPDSGRLRSCCPL
ncbi:MAG: hypothetical protein R3C20_22380 [Planctomycetaceae bacterium]